MTTPPDDILPPLAVNLLRLRAERGWSQAEASAASGVSAQLLGMLEKGKRPNPTLETLQSLAAAYDTTIDELASEEMPTPPELQRLLDSGVIGQIDLATLRRLKRTAGVMGRPLSAQDYIVLLGLMRGR